MTPFIVLSPGRFVDTQGIEVIIQAFAGLYHNVSPKHQKRLRLIIIEETKEFEITENLFLVEKLKDSASVIKREDIEQVEMAYKNASIFFYPSMANSVKIVTEALSYGLPVLTYDDPEFKDVLDKTCSMLVEKKKRALGMDEFLRFLEILYFDPEVRKILSKGAINKFENELNWGGQINRLTKVN